MEPEKALSRREKLIWLAAFFDGEGSISISRGRNQSGSFSYHGHIRFCNTQLEVLEVVRSFLIDVGVPEEQISLYPRHSYGVCMCSTTGAQVLRLILPYMYNQRQLVRAELYCEAFAGERYKRHPEQRKEAWMKYKEMALQEKDLRYGKV